MTTMEGQAGHEQFEDKRQRSTIGNSINPNQDSEKTLNFVLDLLGSPPAHVAVGMGIAYLMYQVWNLYSAK